MRERIEKIKEEFCDSFLREGQRGGSTLEELLPTLNTFRALFEKELEAPTRFSIYHEADPFHQRFGLNFFRPLIDFKASTFRGIPHLEEMASRLACGENVILLANHQTEADPQVISLFLEPLFPKLAQEMIFVAGDRVVRDPIAVPFSLGCNLLCIYSKRYIDKPPEKREEKLLHNRRTLNRMEELLREGGKIIYIAPSGGRDRKEPDGSLLPAPFSPESVELLFLIGKKSGRPTAFYPLALSTHDILPPPATIQEELGERRVTSRTALKLAFGAEISLASTEGSRHELRKIRGARAYDALLKCYHLIYP